MDQIRRFLNHKNFDIGLMVLPLIFLFIFSGLPIIYTIILSFQHVEPFEMNSIFHEFVGLDNYREIFDNDDFNVILNNTVTFLITSVSLQFSIGFTLALTFQRNFPLSNYLRGLFLIPWIMPALVTGAVWSWIFFEKGILNFFLISLGLINTPIFWLSDLSTSLWTIIIANIWLGIPFNMLLLSASLSDIPQSHIEAAKVDGASAIKRFIYIILPAMKNAIFSIITLGLIFTLQQFDLFMALTKGGPSNSSNVMQLWSWQLSFETFDFGQGAALATLIMLFMFIASLFYVLFTSKNNNQ